MRRRVAFLVILGCNGSPAGPNAGSDAGVIDAGSDVDNGMRSTNYPAPHSPLPTLVNAANGPVLTTPNAYFVFYPMYPFEQNLDAFGKAMATSKYWGTTTAEYGVGPLSYKGKIDLTDTPPKTISQADLQTWVGNEILSGAFGVPDPQAIYTIVFPSSTTITQPNPVIAALGTVNSCQAFYGYHDDVTITLPPPSSDAGVMDAGADDAGDAGDAGGTPTTFAYAVIPTCASLASVTETISHEWVEAATDPELTSGGTFTLTGGPNAAYFGPDQAHAIWALLGGGEAGDLCGVDGTSAYIDPSDVGSYVQRTWSNVSAQASHDPCVPAINGAFFDSAPVLDEMVSFTSVFTGTVMSQGVSIPQGQSKTIEVDLFSDGDTGGPWNVSAADLLSTYYGAYGIKPTLDFSWDRTSGQNGEKLHLTITVTGPSLVSGAHAFMITSQLGQRSTIWPGLVVEQ